MESRLALFFISLMLFTLSCSSDSTDDLFIDCAYSAPEKIFSEDLPSVSVHHFQKGNMLGGGGGGEREGGGASGGASVSASAPPSAASASACISVPTKANQPHCARPCGQAGRVTAIHTPKTATDSA